MNDHEALVKMSNDESSAWSASYLRQTTEVMAKAVVAAAAAKSSHASRPSVMFSTKDDTRDGKLNKLQHQVSKMLKGFSSTSPVGKGLAYNPEVLTTQKRQWANIQLQHLDHKSLKEPSKLFESMVVVGLHPHCDLPVLQRQYAHKKIESYSKLPSALAYNNHSRIEPVLEPQVLFVYPPEKQLPLTYKDIVSFCFPGGLEVNAVEKTPSMSELNEILLGQAHRKHIDQSFIFRLQVADNSTLYGCCMLIEEIVDKPSGLLSAIASKQYSSSNMSRYILTTPRCYCILSRLPFFELHFGLLNSIFIEERLERLKTDLMIEVNDFRSKSIHASGVRAATVDEVLGDSLVEGPTTNGNCLEDEKEKVTPGYEKKHNSSNSVSSDVEIYDLSMKLSLSEEAVNNSKDNGASNHPLQGKNLPPNAVLPFLRHHEDDNSEFLSGSLGSYYKDRTSRSDVDDTDKEKASCSGREVSFSNESSVLEWAKEKKCGSLQMICEYYKLQCPDRGSAIRFHPLDHLQSLEYHRPGEADLHISSSTVNLNSCSTTLDLAEAQSALFAEEAISLSTWTISCLCGLLRLEHILTIFAGVLLEKQIVFVSSNLGLLSALVLATVPLIRPYRWQSLLMPILPDDMLEFLDAPVPYIVGIKNKTAEMQSKINCAILVDANKNQVKSSSMPQLPNYRELYAALSPYHAQLVGESFLAQKRPMYCSTPTQADGAKRFLDILRSYLNSLCSNLRSHTITNVQSNNDKVSLLLKDSFIDSFPSRDRSFMKLFVDTQLFSVHTDFVLSLIQKE